MGMKFNGAYRHSLKPNKSRYGLKQASTNWFEHLKNGLKSNLSGQNFTQSKVDPCAFYRRDCIVLCYVDDCVLVSRNTKKIDFIVKSLIDVPEKYLLIDEGTIQNYLGVEIKPGPNEGEFELRQPLLIIKDISHVVLTKEMKGNNTPTPVGRPLLHKEILLLLLFRPP